MIEDGIMSPWLKYRISVKVVNYISLEECNSAKRKLRKVLVKKNRYTGRTFAEIEDLYYTISRYNSITFEGSVPFVIDEKSTKYIESYYFVEQVYRDRKYGFPITIRIGVDVNKNTPRTTNSRISQFVQKIVVDDLDIRLSYLNGQMDDFSETVDYIENNRQILSIDDTDVLKKAAFSFLDARHIVEELKYEPADVWEWSPVKDKKAKAFEDEGVWYTEKNKSIVKLKECLLKNGSASSVFIEMKNVETRYMSLFRENLPTQVFRKSFGRSVSSKHDVFKDVPEIYDGTTLKLDAYSIVNFIKQGLISIGPDVVQFVQSLKNHKYKKFEIYYEGENIKNKISDECIFYEIICSTIRNMEYTTSLVFDDVVLRYVKNTDLLMDILADDYEGDRDRYPILKVLQDIVKNNKSINLWNIISTTYSMFYYSRNNKKRLKYSFEHPIAITVEDVLNYIGDSNFQNCIYEKGFRQTQISETSKIYQILVPGCKYELYEKYVKNNKYVTTIAISKEITEKNDMFIDTMVVVGNDLHQKYGISTNGARRCAFVYGVDMRDVSPGFGVSDILTKGGALRNNFAVHKDDIEKYMEKDGNTYSVLEMSEREIDEMKRLRLFNEQYTWSRTEQYNDYLKAVMKYYDSKNKLKTLDTLLKPYDFAFGKNSKKRILDKEYLMKYINKIDDAIEKNQITKKKDSIKQYMGSLSIYPDFKYGSWGSRRKLVHADFLKKYGFTVDHYIANTKREVRMNISRPREFLNILKTVDLPA